MGRIAVAFNDDADLKPHLNEIELVGEAEVTTSATIKTRRFMRRSLVAVMAAHLNILSILVRSVTVA